MDILTRFRVRFRNPEPKAAHQGSPLLNILPPELLVHISLFLPLGSVGCFALTCKPVYDLLAPWNRHLASEFKTEGIYDFLNLLDRDLPNYVACHCCNKIHSIHESKKYLLTPRERKFAAGQDAPPPCWIHDYNLGNANRIHLNFSSTIFRMAMKVHRQGGNYKPLLKQLSRTGDQYLDRALRGVGLEKLSAKCRIVSGKLLVRKQLAVLVPPGHKMHCGNLSFWICPHLGVVRIFPSVSHMGGYKGLWYGDDLLIQQGDGLRNCTSCATEFRADLVDFHDRRGRITGHAFYFTRWQNLGKGRDPNDVEFTSHLEHGITYETEGKFPRGSICYSFEGRDDFERSLKVKPKYPIFPSLKRD